MRVDNRVKDDSMERNRHQSYVVSEQPTTTIKNQSSKSPPDRKITVTYDTTKRSTNQNHSTYNNNTVIKSGSNTGPIEVVTKITTHSPRVQVKEEKNKSGSRERPKIIQIGGNTRPSVQFSSPPARL